jgi:hypothetical protein
LTGRNAVPILRRHCAPVAEPVDAADSKSVFERSGSSSLPRGTTDDSQDVPKRPATLKKPAYEPVFYCL